MWPSYSMELSFDDVILEDGCLPGCWKHCGHQTCPGKFFIKLDSLKLISPLLQVDKPPGVIYIINIPSYHHLLHWRQVYLLVWSISFIFLGIPSDCPEICWADSEGRYTSWCNQCATWNRISMWTGYCWPSPSQVFLNFNTFNKRLNVYI